jgi:hypothetical protein
MLRRTHATAGLRVRKMMAMARRMSRTGSLRDAKMVPLVTENMWVH